MTVHQPVVFPNPVKQSVTVRHNDISISGAIELVNSQGKVLLVYKAGSRELDLSQFPSGVYMLRLFDNNNLPYRLLKVIKVD
jgi:hypothetical protein